MSKNRGNFFERYIDKAVLGITGIICLCLLWFFVVAGPYSVEYNGRKVGPGQIDKLIKDGQAKRLQDKLDESPDPKTYSEKKADVFAGKIECTLAQVSDDVWFPLPSLGGKTIAGPRQYRLPIVGDVTDVAIEAIRTVAYVPLDEVPVDKLYKDVETEIEDIDLITVEGKFDVAALHEEFRRCFISRVKREWKSESFAKPIFAAVSLERQHILEDGTTSQWQRIPRMKIDHLKTVLDIPDKVQDKNTIELLRHKFDDFGVQKEIIQPDPYDLAASNSQWLTPELHKEFTDLTEKEREKLERENLEKEKELRKRNKEQERNKDRGRGRSRATTGRSKNNRRGSTSGGRGDREKDIAKQLAEKKREAKNKESERTIDVLFDELDGFYIKDDTDLSGLRERLVIWAHDDTAEPGKTYVYRMRVGAFNPIAGQNWLREVDADHNDDLVLWSEYSDVTAPVTIDKRTYFFPKDITGGKVTIQVSKYHKGLWHSEDFKVAAGEGIGKPIEIKAAADEYRDFSSYDSDSDVELVDFNTDTTLIDIAKMSMWMGANILQPKGYAEVLYTSDGENILHMGIDNRNWPSGMRKKYKEIDAAAKEKVTIIARSSGRQRGRRRHQPQYEMMPGMMPGMEMPGMMMPEMMPGYVR